MANLKNDCLTCPLTGVVTCPLMWHADKMGLAGVHNCEMRRQIECFQEAIISKYTKRHGKKEAS